MAKELKAAQDALNEKEQTPQVNKDTLKEAIGKAEALDLTQYKEEGKAEFNAALQNAKAVLEKADADQDEIDQAETETAVEAQAEAETVVETQAEMEVQEAAAQEIRQCRQATAQTCLYMREHYSLQRQRSYSDSEEEIRKNNSDAEGIRTV